MIIKGKYAEAKVMTEDIEQAAIDQIQDLTNAKVAEGCSIVIMPDVHAGKGCTIGTVMTVGERVCPNLVGVDIGCGVLAVRIGEKDMEIDFEKLQKVIDEKVPSGHNVYKEKRDGFKKLVSSLVTPLSENDKDYLAQSLGTLGGGNHFIAIEAGEIGTFLMIHSGSRKLGVLVAKYHQAIAEKSQDNAQAKKDLIARLKREGRAEEISKALAAFPIPEKDDLAFLSGDAAKDYLHDMEIAQKFAETNRKQIAVEIISAMEWRPTGDIESVHNYIDLEKRILRKGAVAAYVNEPFLVPLNMRDGTLVYVAENQKEDWLNSAPHGAGRKMSRTKARAEANLEDYKDTMSGIWSNSVNEATLDENPNAYKNGESIAKILDANFTKLAHLKPVFNFKAN